ncbi:MAG: 4Fe-4S ferredoxin [Candidatus Eisenbacteria bacterium]|nr:4Fe-4S ferredoxin [Candidatus Eisenbacteria bacterium]
MHSGAERVTVTIDEALCDGCGVCLPSCAEGAIRIVNGKARIIEGLCDGLGHCLKACPRGAIRVEPAASAGYSAVEKSRTAERGPGPQAPTGGQGAQPGCGCPGAAFRELGAAAASCADHATMREPLTGHASPTSEHASAAPVSALRHWPVQLALLPAQAPVWQDADLLLAADCVPFAMADFHARLLAGRTLAVACPKLDDRQAYVEKLAEVFRRHAPRSLTIARMEVPCCSGLVQIVREALARAGREAPVREVEVSVRGEVLREH